MPKFTDYTEKQIPEDNDSLMLYDAAAKVNKHVLFSGFWKWIAKKLKEATLSDLQTTDKTVIGALNELNGKKIKQIPVDIAVNENVLSAKLSIDDKEFGVVCLTFAISSAVYASVLINFGSKFSASIIAANGSNSSNFKFDVNAKTLTCNVSSQNHDVHDANALLIK